jgi:predicted PurR-regulated permease PerM
MFDLRTFRVLSTILLFAAVLGFIYLTARVLVVFLFAILFAYLIEPLLPRTSAALHISRGKAIAVIYALIFSGLFLLGWIFAPRIASEGQKLAANFPQLLEKVSSGQIAQEIGAQRGWSFHTRAEVQRILHNHQGDIEEWESGIERGLAQLAGHIWWLALIPILAVFFLKDGRRFGEAVADLFPATRQRDFVDGLLSDLHQLLAEFIRAQLLLTGIAIVVYNLGFVALRLPYAFALGTLAGVLEFIPLLGPLIAAAATLGVALVAGYPHILLLGLFLGVWRIAQDYWVSPHVMGTKVELNPLLVVFGVLVGGEIAGVIGIYLSVPAMATLRVLWRRWRLYQGIKTLAPRTAEAETLLAPSAAIVEPHAALPKEQSGGGIVTPAETESLHHSHD